MIAILYIGLLAYLLIGMGLSAQIFRERVYLPGTTVDLLFALVVDGIDSFLINAFWPILLPIYWWFKVKRKLRPV